MDQKTYKIGICNHNAPRIHRMYKCYDHLYNYNIEKYDVDYGKIKMALIQESFNKLLYQKLKIKSKNTYATAEEIEEYQKIIKPEIILSQMLKIDPLTHDLKVILKEDEKQLYLCRNYIVELNKNIAKLVNITVFQTCCNYIYRLPYGIGCLKNLKMLILSKNRLLELPDEIGYCRELREIDVSFNLLEKLPKSLLGLKKLNTLNIIGNKIKKIPAFLGKLTSLKCIGVKNNPSDLLPLELFKLPFLLNISFIKNDNLKSKFKEVGTLTLMELSARNIIKNNLMIHKNLPRILKNYLLNCQECSFCGGAFFEYYIEVDDYHIFDGVKYPITYRMCMKHYKKHEERLLMLFENELKTIPEKLHRDNMPSVEELFEPLAFNEFQYKKMEEGFKKKGNKIPLISLSKFKLNSLKIPM